MIAFEQLIAFSFILFAIWIMPATSDKKTEDKLISKD